MNVILIIASDENPAMLHTCLTEKDS